MIPRCIEQCAIRHFTLFSSTYSDIFIVCRYVELLKVEKSSESSPRSSDKDLAEPRKSVVELEKTVFILKRVIEKLQVENKRLKGSSRTGHRAVNTV